MLMRIQCTQFSVQGGFGNYVWGLQLLLSKRGFKYFERNHKKTEN
jgi:hypothetical protein